MSVSASLRLGVHGLAAAEMGLVRALVRLLGANSPALRWQFVQEGECDALVADGAAADLEVRRALAARRARAVLMLGGIAGNAGGDALPRPLRAEPFGHWLQRMQAELETAPSLPPATPALPCYRLRRWPPAALMQGEPHRVRMASLLSRRYLTTREMAMLTQQDEAAAVRFVQLLQGFGVVELRQTPPAAALAGPPPDPRRRTLIDGIRRRLGMWLK